MERTIAPSWLLSLRRIDECGLIPLSESSNHTTRDRRPACFTGRRYLFRGGHSTDEWCLYGELHHSPPWQHRPMAGRAFQASRSQFVTTPPSLSARLSRDIGDVFFVRVKFRERLLQVRPKFGDLPSVNLRIDKNLARIDINAARSAVRIGLRPDAACDP
jgi:hypothetical protein